MQCLVGYLKLLELELEFATLLLVTYFCKIAARLYTCTLVTGIFSGSSSLWGGLYLVGFERLYLVGFEPRTEPELGTRDSHSTSTRVGAQVIYKENDPYTIRVNLM